MIPKCWPGVIVIGAWFIAAFLMLRVSAFRIDRAKRSRYFGLPYYWNWKYFNPGNFTPEGRPLLYWLWIVTGVFALGAVLAVSLCV